MKPIIVIMLIGVCTACNNGSSSQPTQSPFPIPGLHLLTNEYAFYQNVLWSPAGDYIAAKQCPVMNYRARCDSGGDIIVLIDPDTGKMKSLELLNIRPNIKMYDPVLWSPKGNHLLILITEELENKETLVKTYKSTYLLYNPETELYSELDIEGTVISWERGDSRLFIHRYLNENTLVLGWLSLEDNVFEEEIRFTHDGQFLGYFKLSPDNQTVLVSNSFLPQYCDEIQTYQVGSKEGFTTFLSLACFPSWSQDGKKLAYVLKDQPQRPPYKLMISNADGSNSEILFSDDISKSIYSPTWSPDGVQIAFAYDGQEGTNAIYILEVPEDLHP
jgi:WD40 repeat protein